MLKQLIDKLKESLAIAEEIQSEAQQPDDSRTLRLVWPTDFQVFTQRFGERPEFYSKFNLPGHEGVDIRCPTGGKVYAAAAGIVKAVDLRWRADGREHPYGYQIRIRHTRNDGEYETIYAHLVDKSAKVRVGDAVKARQHIADGDNTGNSTAAHLHFTLKRIGAKNGGYGEIIDPAPYFVEGPH